MLNAIPIYFLTLTYFSHMFSNEKPPSEETQQDDSNTVLSLSNLYIMKM